MTRAGKSSQNGFYLNYESLSIFFGINTAVSCDKVPTWGRKGYAFIYLTHPESQFIEWRQGRNPETGADVGHGDVPLAALLTVTGSACFLIAPLPAQW